LDAREENLDLRLIESAHTSENIDDHIYNVIDDFGCTNKVISITLDNASSNSRVSAMEILGMVKRKKQEKTT
jgi:hypothetical protein